MDAIALTGSRDSTVGLLETVRPKVLSVTAPPAPPANSLSVAFSEPVGSGAGLAGSYTVSGADGAGNLGALGNSSVLEIMEKAAAVPVGAGLVGLALMAAGVVVLVWRRKRVAILLLLVTLLAAPMALAQEPTVENVTFTQNPNKTTGTKVDIYYDLVAPGNPCTITLSLSKDAGADGFVHLIKSYTGDITNVTTRAI